MKSERRLRGVEMSKLRNTLTSILGLMTLILGLLLFRQKRVTEKTESELANALADKRITEADHDREIARKEADALVKSYERLKSEYDKAHTGDDMS